MFKSIPKSNINFQPFKVYKEYSLTESDIVPYFGKNISGSFYEDTDEQSNGIYKRTLYNSIKEQFYRLPQTGSILTTIGLRKSYTSTDERNIENDIAVLSIPQSKYGESIKAGSLTLNDGGTILIDDGYSNLVESGSDTIYGNIFYDRGLVVITDNVISGSTLSDFELDFKSVLTIYENEVLLTVNPNDYNVSQNPTAHTDGYIKLYNFTSSIDPTKFGGFGDYDYSSSIDPTGSYLAPFITTIGLYDDNNNMVAVAKLPRPVKCELDYPMNFIVRWDS